jgi:hypothetical protein
MALEVAPSVTPLTLFDYKKILVMAGRTAVRTGHDGSFHV